MLRPTPHDKEVTSHCPLCGDEKPSDWPVCGECHAMGFDEHDS